MVKKFICVLLVCCFCISANPVFAETQNLMNVNVDRIALKSGENFPYYEVYSITENELAFTSSYLYTYEIHKGMFGKDITDYSARICSESLEEAALSYLEFTGITESSYEVGDILDISFKTAYGVLHGPNVTIKAVDGSGKLVYTGAMMQVSDSGAVNFVGVDYGTIPNYKTNRWYDYRIIIKIDEESFSTSLYIDNVPYIEDFVFNGAIRGFTEFTLACHGSKSKYPAGTKMDTYVDDIKAKKYIGDDEPVINQISIESSLDCVSFDGVSIKVDDRSITVDEFLESLSGNYESVEYIKDNKLDEYPEIGEGLLRLTMEDGSCIFKDVKVSTPQIKPGLAYFDVTGFKFVRRGTTVGAKANIFNYRSWEEKTAVMVMVLKDEAGAVRKVYSSPVVTAYSPDGQTVEFPVEIAPVENEGYKPYVFFLSDWDEYLSVKDRIYK